MISAHTLIKIKTRGKKRVGRGRGSGKGGHTVGRGQKGQKSREKVKISFFGTKVKKSLLKRVPMLRGKGKLKPRGRTVAIKIEALNRFLAQTLVNQESLVKAGLIEEGERVKIVGGGKLDRALKIAVPVSSKVAQMIKEQGGEIVLKEGKENETP